MPDDLGPCPICGRSMIDGPSVDRHHWIPKSRGGGAQSTLHKVCHRKLHAAIDEVELATNYSTAEALRTHPDIAKFIHWVRRKHPEWMDWHNKPLRHR